MKNKPEDFDRWGTPTGMTYPINTEEKEDIDEIEEE